MTDIEALRARMRETAESGFDYLEVPASDCLALDAEITRLREDLDRVTRERDEARALFNACAEARDEAGFTGSVPECIVYLAGNLERLKGVGLRELATRARAEAAEASLASYKEEVERLRKQITSASLDALAADGQAQESYAAAMALCERLTAILDWCDLAADQPGTFNQQGVKLLQGPAFDAARNALAEYTIYAPKETPHAK